MVGCMPVLRLEEKRDYVHRHPCRGDAFAGMYEGSDLKRTNEVELDSALQQRSIIKASTMQELAITRATVTPFWWGLWVMLRVSRMHRMPTSMQLIMLHPDLQHDIAADSMAKCHYLPGCNIPHACKGHPPCGLKTET